MTERSIHLYVDIQRIFSAEGPRPTPWGDKVSPVATTLAHRHPDRTGFTRFIPPEAPGSATTLAGVLATREHLDLQLLDLMSRYCRPCE